jgi:hypothetical protein
MDLVDRGQWVRQQLGAVSDRLSVVNYSPADPDRTGDGSGDIPAYPLRHGALIENGQAATRQIIRFSLEARLEFSSPPIEVPVSHFHTAPVCLSPPGPEAPW